MDVQDIAMTDCVMEVVQSCRDSLAALEGSNNSNNQDQPATKNLVQQRIEQVRSLEETTEAKEGEIVQKESKDDDLKISPLDCMTEGMTELCGSS